MSRRGGSKRGHGGEPNGREAAARRGRQRDRTRRGDDDNTVVGTEGRRVRLVVALLAITALGVGIGLWRRWPGPNGPLAGRGEGLNVLLITLDTTRADCLGCYGHPVVGTPHIDALAREGVRFTQCTATAPLTLPSHASIMTATYPFVHRARLNGRYLADKGNVTLAELLKPAGYATGAEVGAYVLDAIWGIDQGFDSYRSEKAALTREDRFERLANLQSEPADSVCDRALEWLGEHAAERFFLWVHFFDPHQPWQPPERFRAPYANARFGAYWGEIAFVDEQVGRLMGEFRRLGLEDHTLVVLTADHGEGLLQHRELTHGYYVYDSTLRVPLILRCPSRVPEERVIDSQVRTVDIAPTVLAFLGLEPSPVVQGQSLLPLAEGAADDLSPAAYGESVSAHDSYGYARLRTCRTDGWKYIHAPKPELYDIENDPHETVNLADRYPERVETMRNALEELIAESLTGAADVEQVGVLDAAAAEKLAGLGYVGGYSPESSTKNELELFGQFEGPDPKDHVDSFNRFLEARAWINSDQPANAEPMLHGLIAAEPSAPAFRDYYAKLLQKLGRPEEAVEQYRSLLELQPDNAVAHYRLGKVFGELGRLDDSVTHLRRAAEAMPEYAEAHAYLALALARQGRLQEAEGCFRRVLELDPANEDACTELSALLQRRGLGGQAVGILREGLRRRPDSLKLSNNLAWFLATAADPELRDGQEAVRLVRGIRQRMPEDDASILDTLAAAYAAAGRFDEAVVSARRALDLAESLELADLAAEVRARLALYESGRAYYAQP